MQVVRHELKSEKPDLGIELRYFPPARCDSLTQGRGIEPRLRVAVVGTVDGTKQGTATFNHEGNHIDARRLIVMVVMTPFHGLMPGQVGMGIQALSLALAQGHFIVVITEAEPRSTGQAAGMMLLGPCRSVAWTGALPR